MLPTLIYTRSEVVIPAPFFNGVNSSGNPVRKYWIPGQARNDNHSKRTFDAVHEKIYVILFLNRCNQESIALP